MIAWIEAHTAGWEMLLPAYLLVAIGVAVVHRGRLKRWLVAVPLMTWVVLCASTYAITGMHRFLGYARPRWLAMVFTLLLVTAVPVVTITAAASWKKVRQASAPVAFAVPVVLAFLCIPLTNLMSAELFVLLRPYFD